MPFDLPRLILAIVALVGLIGGSLWVLTPFLAALIWAAMIAVATWPLMLRLQRLLWGRRALAVTVMTVVMLLVFIVPVLMALGTLIENADNIGRWAQELTAMELPEQLPATIGGLPVVGGLLNDAWIGLRALELRSVVIKLTPYAGSVARWLGSQAGGAGLLIVHFLLTILLTAVLYLHGETAARMALVLARRIGATHGEHAVRLAGSAIRGVALGVVGTALIQALAAGLGMWVAGVPMAGLLTAAAFLLCIAQIGAAPILMPAVIWLFWTGSPGWGTFLIVWSIVVVTMDNVIRPLLIRYGADLPLLLIFAGVIGGLLSMGFVGLFVGPVLLAVTFMLFQAWTEREEPAGDSNAAVMASAAAGAAVIEVRAGGSEANPFVVSAAPPPASGTGATVTDALDPALDETSPRRAMPE